MDIKIKLNEILEDGYFLTSNKWMEKYGKKRPLSLILSLIHQEIEKTIPKKEKLEEKEIPGFDSSEHYYFGCRKGYNQAIYDIRKALKDRGLI